MADVNILLPPKMTHPVEYRLQGSDGCFKWSWDHHDILWVLPEYNSSSHCSMSARLRSIAPYGGRKETVVYATDLSTGMIIRCKVYIDMISRIQIFHNSIKLDLDGLATLRVRAFDSEEPSVEHFADKIVLTVAEAMSLDPPSPVNDLIGAVVHYTLKVIRSNSPHIVTLPSPFHQWSALNSSVANVDRAMGIIHALNLGITTLVVEDTRVVGHMQISSFHVASLP
ncbi:hypothetical protein ACS0TY_003077 [Phlomoides rotata]